MALQQLQLLQRHRQLRKEHVGCTAVDVMHHHQLKTWGLPADFLQQLPPQGLLRRFAEIKVTAKESPAAGRNDRGNLVAQLHEPATMPRQHRQGDFNGHGAGSGCCRPALLRGVERGTTRRKHQATADGEEHQHLQQ